jgi:PEP-CTERM motif
MPAARAPAFVANRRSHGAVQLNLPVKRGHPGQTRQLAEVIMRTRLIALVLLAALPAYAEIYYVQPVVSNTGASLLAPGISPNGWVGGQAQDTLLPVIWRPDGSSIDVPTLGGNRGGVFSINQSNVALGNARTDLTPQSNLAFLRQPDGTINVLPAPTGGVQVTTNALNDSNAAVGNFRLASDNSVARGWRWSPSAGTIELGRPTGFDQSTAIIINNAGTSAGWVFNAAESRAVRWDASGSPSVISGAGGLAFGIDDAGVIVGALGSNAAVWLPDGTELDLGNLGTDFTALYTNRSGVAYGLAQSTLTNPDGSTSVVSEAVAWDPVGGLRLFNPQFVLDPAVGSFSLSVVYDSNLSGQLVGQDCTVNPLCNTFLLTAVPEPATWSLMIIGFGMIFGAAVRRQRPRWARPPAAGALAAPINRPPSVA